MKIKEIVENIKSVSTVIVKEATEAVMKIISKQQDESEKRSTAIFESLHKGSIRKKKCHKLWKKSRRGGGSNPKSKKSTFQMQTTLTRGGGSEFFTFFPISIILQLFCNITFIRNVYISNFFHFRSRGEGSSKIKFFPHSKQSTLSSGVGY